MEDRAYHELPAQPREEPARRLGFWQSGKGTKIVGVLSAFLVLVILVFFLWPRDPDVELEDLDFKSLNLNTTGGVRLDVNLLLTIEVDNPNFFEVDYDRVTVHIYYHGDELAKIKSSAGSVPARKAVNLTAKAKLQGLEIVKNAAKLISDAAREKVPLSITARFDGNIAILLLKPSIKVTVACDLVVNPSNNTVLSQECGNQPISAPRNLVSSSLIGLPSWAVITLIVLLTVIVIAALLWLVWPKAPELSVQEFQLLGISADSKFTDDSMIPEVVLDINLGVDLRVRNRNVIGVRYDTITIRVFYYGYEVCKGELAGGEIPARGSVTAGSTLDLRGKEIAYNSAQLLTDVSKRELPMHIVVDFSGRVGIWWLKPHIKAVVGYDLTVDPVSNEILRQDYQFK